MKPVSPTTFPGSVSVGTALQSIAEKAGLTTENNGVLKILASPYFDGTAWTQLLSLVRMADVFGFVDGVKKLVAIWPKNGSRTGGETIISPETGMIGYPQFQTVNILVRTLFSPEIKSGIGQQITVQSQLTAADGKFIVMTVTLELASELPDGPWESVIEATPVKQAA
jgi:hypothetical protein